VGFKVDMLKAYDRVDCSFLLKVLELFSFTQKCCDFVHQCIATVKFSVLVNATPVGFFSPSCGI